MRHWEKHRENQKLRSALGVAAVNRNLINGPCPDYPAQRENGVIIQAVNKQIVVVDLIPEGRCDQWLALFPSGEFGVAGMNDIHAEIRRIMPPAGSVFTY